MERLGGGAGIKGSTSLVGSPPRRWLHRTILGTIWGTMKVGRRGNEDGTAHPFFSIKFDWASQAKRSSNQLRFFFCDICGRVSRLVWVTNWPPLPQENSSRQWMTNGPTHRWPRQETPSSLGLPMFECVDFCWLWTRLAIYS